jgi:hypothetical protein
VGVPVAAATWYICAVQNPQEQMQGVMAIRNQAAAWLTATKADLVARGLGFTSDDLAAISAAHATQTPPDPNAVTPEQREQAMKVAQQAASAEYPANGVDPSDSRLAPIGNMTLAQYAIAASAVMWGNDDQILVARVMGALGHDAGEWKAAGDGFTPLISGDIVIATLYGQLFAQVGDLPAKAH